MVRVINTLVLENLKNKITTPMQCIECSFFSNMQQVTYVINRSCCISS